MTQPGPSAKLPGAAVLAGNAASKQPLLAVSDVHKAYRTRRSLFASRAENRAIDGVSLSVHAGEILGLVGESGCGKSTFAKVLLGLEQADAGTMQFDGQPIFAPAMTPVPSNRRGIQMVFQDPFGSLNPRKPVGDIIAEGLRIRGGVSRKTIAAEVVRQLALVGLSSEAMGKYPHQFSGGQRQRICIARAIIMQPKLLIADEAVSALDVSVQMQILNLLLDLRDQLGLTIMFISHDIGVIEYLCDRICVMYQGRIVEQGTTADVIDAAQHPYTAHLIAARPRIAAITGPSAGPAVAQSAGTAHNDPALTPAGVRDALGESRP